jgi:hypothetical protein
MLPSPTRSHLLILPLIVLAVVLLEEVAEYQLRKHVQEVHLRTLVMMALYAVGFTVAFDSLGPLLKRLLLRLRKGSRKQAGIWGIWLFFALSYALMFYGYLTLELHGPTGLIPNSWR